MSAERILERLQCVRSTGLGKWIARCPAHDDRSPSLSIRECDDGRALVHCFGGCDTSEVIAAIGLQMSDLFPPLCHRAAAVRQPFSALQALLALSRESSIVAVAAADLADGRAITAEDATRVAIAAGRIAEALAVVHG
jgi:hypothetical protein